MASCIGTQPRWANMIEDAVLTVQLLTFFILWLRRRPKTQALAHRVAFYLYALNLILAAIFTCAGALLHVTDPLPQHPTMHWRIFLLALAATPVIFPVVCSCALFPAMSRCSGCLCAAWLVVSGSLHTLFALTGVDLGWHSAFPLAHMAGIVFDGRSIGGEACGIKFDLLSSIPCFRGDSLFVHCSMFMGTCLGTILMCLTAESGPCQRRLSVALLLMLSGQVSMVPLLAVVGMQGAFSVWHVLMFAVMALAYSSLWTLVSAPASNSKTKSI